MVPDRENMAGVDRPGSVMGRGFHGGGHRGGGRGGGGRRVVRRGGGGWGGYVGPVVLDAGPVYVEDDDDETGQTTYRRL